MSRETTQRIVAATDGAVTPADFLPLAQPGRKGLDMHHPVTAAIEAFVRGEIVVVTDDDDRENEGDLIVAASLCTTEKMAFIIRNGCGIVCAPMTAEDARRLHLPPMVATNEAPLATAFTVSVDGKHGLTTGISAEQRCNTVRALANGNMGASDFVRPGHVFPLVARDGGVLMRSGHTEAAVDLCKLAGLPPVAVICELANDDGTVMVGPQIEAFADKHNLKRISVADLIAYRQAREKLVERVVTFPVRTPIGELQGYGYRTPFDPFLHFAFVHGSIGDGRNMPARLHRCDIVSDIFGAGAIPKVLRRFKAEGRGALVYLRDGAAGVPANLVGAERMSSDGARASQWREIGLGAQILRDLGVTSIRLRTDNPRVYVGLSGFGIEITAVEPIDG
jgi:3,4-dihydroxy 2-butanone 4-phosphate synthase/GTP cyclohydrolase II